MSIEKIDSIEYLAEQVKRLSGVELNELCELLVDDYIGHRIKDNLDIIITEKTINEIDNGV
jgi:hypothetical protein